MRRGGLSRACSVTLALLTLGLASVALSLRPALAQANFDRPGADYAQVPILTGDPAVCALACERDRRCRAWSFSYPRDPQDGAVCWLKSSVPQRIESSCCVSGVRGAGVLEPRNSDTEASIDRFGGDYKSFEMKGDERDEACRTACAEDDNCRAWTFARPGYVGREARCFLKKDIKPPRRKPGFISGVVR